MTVPVEHLHPGDPVMTHRHRFRRVQFISQCEYRGTLAGLRRRGCGETLWITPCHRVATALPPLPKPQANVDTARALRRASTRSEDMLWQALRARCLQHRFRRQHVLGPFVVDFFCPDLRIAVELDGAVHSTLDQRLYDRSRQETIAQHKVAFLRFRNGEVERRLDTVLGRISSMIAQREQEFALGIRWVPAENLRTGVSVLCSGRKYSAAIVDIAHETVSEPVYSLTVQEDAPYVTEVCTVHNYSSPQALPPYPSSSTPLPHLWREGD